MKRRQIVVLGLFVGLVAGSGQGLAQDCSGSTRFQELSTGAGIPTEALFTSRADLSNPGARALALGGAFISSADDSTSAIANPAGLSALIRPTVQFEGRFGEIVRYDVYGNGVLTPGRDNGAFVDKKGTGTGFLSVAFPFADIFVADVFYQRVLTANDLPRRPGTSGSGPCILTKNPFSGADLKVYLPYGDQLGSNSIDRYGVALGVRLSYRVSLGVSAFYAHESRDETYLQIEAGTPDAVAPFPVNGTSAKYGAIVGLQFTPTEAVRIGATYSLPVEFHTNYASNPSKQTVLPARAGLGVTFAATSKLAIALEADWNGTSRIKDATNFRALFSTTTGIFDEATNPGNWEVKDTVDVRLGMEYTVASSMRSVVNLRLGAFTETLALPRFHSTVTPDNSTRFGFDTVSTLFPNQDDPRLWHVSGGIGALFSKKVQADLGVDYETKTKAVKVSGLFGYTF